MLIEVIGGLDPEKVNRQTWGHLDADPNMKHYGAISFAESEYGEQFILSLHFDTPIDGPWFYERVHEWLASQETERGEVYRWFGWYRHDGITAEFHGRIVRLSV